MRNVFRGYKTKSFKDFRHTKEFREVARDISQTVMRILDDCEVCPSLSEHLSIPGILDNFEEGQVDFNDLIIADICRERDLLLITDDADFGSLDLHVVTANETLLRFG
jgi:predicted nucleic acid-binding protein